MNKSTIANSVLGFAVIAALLTGCSGPAADLIPTIPSQTAAAVEPTAAPAEAPVAATKTGDVVDAVQAKVILKARQGQRAYPMADGTFVVVTKTEPLPANVQADANAKAVAVVAAYPDGTVDSDAAIEAMQSALGSFTAGTGKRVIIIWSIFGYPDGMSETKSSFWTVSGGSDRGSTIYLSRDEATAAVTAQIGADASEYMIVYSD